MLFQVVSAVDGLIIELMFHVNYAAEKVKEVKSMVAVIYIHGRGGSEEEAEHYKRLFPSCDVIGIEYAGCTPWEAGEKICEAVDRLKTGYERMILIANSIGAFYAMNSGIEKHIAHAYFISPIVDMNKLITDMMDRAGVTEPDLQKAGVIYTDLGEELSWKYLCYVREHPVRWSVPTDILYGSEDNLTSVDTVASFVESHDARLTVMDKGEHWFHTEGQMRFLDNWIRINSSS